MKETQLSLSHLRRLFLSLGILVLVFGTGYRLGQQNQLQLSVQNGRPRIEIQKTRPLSQPVDFSLFWEVWDRLQKSYLYQEKLDQTRMVQGAIAGMVSALEDPYTVFLTPEENQRAKEDLDGSFFGVGIQLGYQDDRIAVIAPLAGMPAEKAGVKAGDLILKVDGQDTSDLSLPEAVNLIRGQKGTPVTLTLSQNGHQSREITIKRDEIKVPSVEFKFLDSSQFSFPASQKVVAYLKLSRFGETTASEWRQAIAKIISHQPPVTGVVLDLRNNPGGLMDQSIPVISEFIKSGAVLKQQDQRGNQRSFMATGQGRLLDTPLIVLVNQGSASASEIVAGALQELGRAKLVGETTFGKGTIQDARELPGGAGLHLTTGRWLLPSGQHLNGQGLKPDIEIAEDLSSEKDTDLWLQRAVEELFE